MGLHASYYPTGPAALAKFIADVHSDEFWKEVSAFREESIKGGREFYVGTAWHILDFVINPPDVAVPELLYAVRGHEFPAPDGSVRLEPHLASYNDEYWQAYTYVTSAEAEVIAQYLPLIDETEFEARFDPRKMKGIYRAPLGREADKREYFDLLVGLQDFYKKVAADSMAVLIVIG